MGESAHFEFFPHPRSLSRGEREALPLLPSGEGSGMRERGGRITANLTAAVVAVTVTLSGCDATRVVRPVEKKIEEVKKGPERKPFRSITNFSAALRCMDGLMLQHGVRDVSVLVEDLTDQTKKVNAGTKDMLISAVSDMNRRSRAIRLVAYGADSGNLIGFLRDAERKNAYAVVPEFDIRGSISQFDENVAKKSAEFGFGFGEDLVAGYGRSATATILGIDLTMLSTADLSVIPGVSSRNAVVIFKSGSGTDGDARYRKLGVNFSTTLNKAEGNAQALRNLVELASIELFGKLAKVPYWTCLDADPNAPEVQEELADWFYAMEANGTELIYFLQKHTRLKGYYSGPVDGEGNPQLADAAVKARTALGMSREPKADLDLFKAIVNGQLPQASTELAAAPAEAPKAAAGDPALALSIVSRNAKPVYKRGEPVALSIRPNRDAYVYCYLHNDEGQVQRFFPNRFLKDPLVPAAKPLELPGAMRFQLVASERGKPETVACFAAPKEVLAALPEAVRGVDFEPLQVGSLEEVHSAFVASGGTAVAAYTLNVR